MNLRVSLGQINVKVGDIQANLQKVSEWTAEAARRGSQFILFPELWSTGYALDQAQHQASRMGNGIYAEISALARRHQIWFGGSTLEAADGKVYNTFTLFTPSGQPAAMYRKIHLFRLMQEDEWLAPGDQLVKADLGFIQAGITICYDLRFPEIYRYLAIQGARLMLNCAEWPIPRVEHWCTLLKARAIENQAIVVAVNAAGESAGTVYGGHSAVLGAWGETLAEADADECLLTVDVDLSSPDQARKKMDILNDRRPEVYR